MPAPHSTPDRYCPSPIWPNANTEWPLPAFCQPVDRYKPTRPSHPSSWMESTEESLLPGRSVLNRDIVPRRREERQGHEERGLWRGPDILSTRPVALSVHKREL